VRVRFENIRYKENQAGRMAVQRSNCRYFCLHKNIAKHFSDILSILEQDINYILRRLPSSCLET
jgi:hypothetical protein